MTIGLTPQDRILCRSGAYGTTIAKTNAGSAPATSCGRRALLAGLVAPILAKAQRFLVLETGVAALEFALILPIMILLYGGCVEITSMMSIDRKVSRAASTIADLVSQQTSMNTAGMTNIFDASTAILEPQSAASAKLLLIVVSINGTTQKVVWSSARNTDAYAADTASPVVIPTSLAVSGTQVVVGRVTYTYSSPLLTLVGAGNSMDLEHEFLLRPRQSSDIPWTN